MKIRLQIFLCLAVLIANFALVAQTNSSPAPTPTPTIAIDSEELSKLRADLLWARKVLADWPDLARYRDENARMAAPTVNESRVVFMGDSITDGWGRQYGSFFPGKPYVNRGISGQTTPQMLIRFHPDVIALKPKVVVILAGTNDIAGNTGPMTLEQIEDNFVSMAELARANGIKVVISSVMPVSDDFQVWTDRRPLDKIVTLNAWIKAYAAKNGFVYLDYYSAMIDERKMFKRELTYDGLHPNAAGYNVMGPLAEKAITLALRKDQ
jgi:lysophospholipase L1-like esterase